MDLSYESLNDHVKHMVDTIKLLIQSKKVNINNAIDLLKITMTHVERIKGLTGKEKAIVVMHILDIIAKGDDGIAGTNDDLIPQHVINGVKALLENNLIESTISFVIDASKGKIDINNVKGCLKSLSRFVRKIINK